ITQKLAIGVSLEEITKVLIDAGWDKEKVMTVTAQFSSQSTGAIDKTKEYINKVLEEKEHIKNKTGTFIAWVKEDWIMKLGGGLLIIAFGWFITYAINVGWLGPAGQITLGILAGVAILLLGEWRVRTFKNQGAFFLALGAGIILLTIFAGREVYEFFTPGVALGAMFITVVFTALSSVRHDSKSLATLSLGLAFVAPILTNSTDPSFVSLFSYLFLITVGVLWIVKITKWNELTLGALIGTSIYSMFYVVFGSLYWSGLIDGTTLFNIPFLFSIAFGIVFFLATMAGALKTFEKNKSDIITAALNGIFIIGWILVAVPDVWQSLVAASWAAIFSIGAFAVYNITSNTRPFFVYGIVAASFIGVATALELSGPALTIAATLEVLGVIILTSIMTGSIQATKKTAFLVVIPIFLSVQSFNPRVWKDSIFHGDFVVLALIVLMLFSLGTFFYFKEREEETVVSHTSVTLLVAGGVYLISLIWLSANAIFPKNTAVTISLAIYTISGIFMYIKGVAGDLKALKAIGGILIGLVVLRLLFVDVWNLDMAGRILTFFSVGVLLISTAFFTRKKKKEKINNNI
ncbi:MAG TPA: DUF2339 domain-containing protein, partial [Candidatus Yonathbacteria bacterium]|nr:DUF2339 domain-containing protein [Candidatus Yonathbacteria bacterium]